MSNQKGAGTDCSLSNTSHKAAPAPENNSLNLFVEDMLKDFVQAHMVHGKLDPAYLGLYKVLLKNDEDVIVSELGHDLDVSAPNTDQIHEDMVEFRHIKLYESILPTIAHSRN